MLMLSYKMVKYCRELLGYGGTPLVTVTVNFNGGSWSVPATVVKTLLVLGALSIVYHTKDFLRLSLSFVRSAKSRVLQLFPKERNSGTAVIYGATCKIGRAFALKLAASNTPLVLIDFSIDKLNKLKGELLRQNKELEDSITCCTLGEEVNIKDVPSICQVLKQQRQISYFVNCRNLKETNAFQFHRQKLPNILFMSHYNLIVYTVLLRQALKIMAANCAGNVICLNSTYRNEEILKRTHPLFFASSCFVLHLTHLLQLSYKDMGINFLQLNPSFHFVPNVNCEGITKNSKYLDIAEYSLNKLGLSSNVYF